MKAETFDDALVVRVPTTLTYNLAGKGYTRFKATVAVDKSSVRDDIGPRVRFFVFSEEPDPDQLVRVKADTPVAPPVYPRDRNSLIASLYRYSMARDATPAEVRDASEFLGHHATPEGLQDLLWSLFMSPEFQFIR